MNYEISSLCEISFSTVEKRQSYHASASQSLNPFANGLLAIFSCVICRENIDVRILFNAEVQG